MKRNEYAFTTHWRVQSTCQEISEVLGNGPDLTRWWPSVYLDVQELESGNKDGIGKVVSLFTKGWLPYTLRWQFRVIANRSPNGFSLEAWGDFVGTGDWTFTQNGDWVEIIYDWRIRADKPLLRWLSFIMKPIFSANHHWAMRKGEESLKLELARRHAKTIAERKAVPPPPKRTFSFYREGMARS
ncbi:MAG: polyketide cyclase [Ardenticatenaceae bacterium]|nr:polyketide cyclase [Ardenticatenaceae bacterium]